MISFTINGQLRGGKNAILTTRTGHRYPNPSWAKTRDEVLKQIMSQRKNPPITQRSKITINYWPGDKRRRDVPGMMDFVFHVLEKAGVVKDDALFADVYFVTMEVNQGKPWASITIFNE